MFDIQLAIAALDMGASHGVTATEILRERHPEFRAIADEIEELRDYRDNSVPSQDYDALESECGDLEDRVADLERALRSILRIADTLDESKDSDILSEAMGEIAGLAAEMIE